MRSSDGTKRSAQPILRSGEAPSTTLFPLRVGCLPSEMRSYLLYLPRDAPANVMKIKLLNQVSLRSCTLLLLSGHDSVPQNAACPSNSRFMDGKHCLTLPSPAYVTQVLYAPRREKGMPLSPRDSFNRNWKCSKFSFNFRLPTTFYPSVP